MSDTTLESIFSPDEYAKLKHAADLLNLPVEQLIRNAALQLLYQRSFSFGLRRTSVRMKIGHVCALQ